MMISKQNVWKRCKQSSKLYALKVFQNFLNSKLSSSQVFVVHSLKKNIQIVLNKDEHIYRVSLKKKTSP
jgi:hypothetical protein